MLAGTFFIISWANLGFGGVGGIGCGDVLACFIFSAREWVSIEIVRGFEGFKTRGSLIPPPLPLSG